MNLFRVRFTWEIAPCQVVTKLCEIDRSEQQVHFVTFVTFGAQGGCLAVDTCVQFACHH